VAGVSYTKTTKRKELSSACFSLSRPAFPRETECATAAQLFQTARAQGRSADTEASNETLQRILEETPHSFRAWYALEWIK